MNASPRHRFGRRLMLAFAGFALVVAGLFGLYVVVFAYAVEDQFFRSLLQQEATEQLQHHARTGGWKTPRESWVAVVEDPARLPDGIGAILREEPARTEFPGPHGRHYHLQRLQPPEPGKPAWLLAEVGERLVVRPQRAVLFELLAWSGMAVVALALLLAWWLARRVTAPLSRLAAQVDGTTPEQWPAEFARTYPDDEVGVLARGLESLIARIRAFVQREREFTRDASHELRTPLAVIRGCTERLAGEPALTADARALLAHVRHSAAQLEQTVDTLLGLAREEACAASAVPVPVLPVVERVVVEQSPLLEGKAIDVEIAIPERAVARMPAAVLHILLSNLVGNAFAHGRAGRVSITVRDSRLSIANPGTGVREGDFAPFAKGESSAGFGLGLAIVRRLCERHGIDVAVDTAADGTIASFALDAAGCGKAAP